MSAAGARRLLLAAAVAVAGACGLQAARPVVFLHGYGGDASTWEDFVPLFESEGYGADDILVFEYYDSKTRPSGAAAGLSPFGFDKDEPIETIAEVVAARTRVWLRRRAGLADDDGSRDAELPAPDWVCHSMGGLVFRLVLTSAPDLVHRCVDLATPHFGQNLAVDGQSRQMKYGSSFLWRLADDWFFRGHSTENMIFVVGVAAHNFSTGDVMWDGLVSSFSATLLTLDDGAAFSNRTFFVNRVHTKVMEAEFVDNDAILRLRRGTDDPVFKLAYGYLNDCGYFAGGHVPTLRETMFDDGASTTRVEKVEDKVAGFGGLFVQAVEPTTNAVGSIARPIRYDPGVVWADPVVTYLENVKTGDKFEYSDTDGFFDHGPVREGCTNGLVFVFGAIPAGTYKAKVKAPSKIETPWSYPYYFKTTIAAGGVRVIRTRPGNAAPASSFTLRDGAGGARAETVPNDWFADRGLAASAEDLEGCVAAGTNVWANGLTGAASHWLGLDPADPGSTLAISSIGSDGGIVIGARLGAAPLVPAALPPGASAVLQSKAPGAPAWTDETAEQDADGLWRVPAAEGRLFRLEVRVR